ncbi:MAG: dethiobiotin synthase [Chlorobiaceae bacterium]
MSGSVLAVSGIDTGIGKTYVTGMLSRALQELGVAVITQKIAQTGCSGVAEDIVEHRRLMGIPLQDVDREGHTCPFLFSYPASPHLAARLESKEIDLLQLGRSTALLQQQYEMVLLEGAGGLLVPLTPDCLFADYIRDEGYPLVLVTAPRLGSINHTLLSIEACMQRGLVIRAVVYNRFGEADPVIAADTREVISRQLKKAGCRVPLIDLVEGALATDAARAILQQQ